MDITINMDPALLYVVLGISLIYIWRRKRGES